MTRTLRKVDARAWFALVMIAFGLLWNWDSFAQEVSEDGVVESCSYYDILDMVLGPVAFLLALGALISTDVGRHRISTAAVSVAGMVGGVLVTLHGFGRIGGRCEDGAGEGTAALIIGVLTAVAIVVVFLDRSQAIPPPALVVEGSHAPVYEGGVKRCLDCKFSSNPIDATECRLCGSTDLVAVPDEAASPSGADQP